MFYTVIITFTNKRSGESIRYNYTSTMRVDCENKAIRMIADSNIEVDKIEFIEKQ